MMVGVPPIRTSRRLGSRAVLAAVLLLAAVPAAIMACSGASPGPTGSVAPSTGNAGPRPTHWPSEVVESTVALGLADSEFVKVGADLKAAIDSRNMETLLTSAKDVEAFLTGNRKNVPRLQGYGETKDVGDRLAAAYDQMIAGITEVRESLESGDADGVTTGFQTFVAGNTAYSAVRSDLGVLVEQAIFMKRLLLQ
jgi:hypothetical protein